MPDGSVTDAGGVQVHFESQGSGPVVMATHGFTSSSHVWRPLATELADRYQVVSWDIRGHGRSDYPLDGDLYTAAASVCDMLAVLDAVGTDRAVLVGHSLGGYLTLEFQLAHPERVAGMVLVGTGPGYRKDEARAGWNEQAERFASSFEKRGLDALSTSGEVDRAAHRDASGLARAARGILSQRDSRVLDHLAEINVPNTHRRGGGGQAVPGRLAVHGRQDPRRPLGVIPGSGHSPMTDAPGRLLATVRSHLVAIWPAP
jgi:pimeloyl-ACP methyl ester carboxylesterase